MVRRTALLLAFLVTTPALAGSREDVYSSSLRCSAITDDRTWLECYYGSAQPMRGQLQLPPAPASQTSLIPPAIGGVAPNVAAAYQQPPRAVVAPKPGPIGRTIDFIAGGDAIVTDMAIKTYEAGRQGGTGFTVTLANGQVWKQSDDQVRQIRFRGAAESHHVTIHKGALNSFNLNFDEESEAYKVRRIK